MKKTLELMAEDAYGWDMDEAGKCPRFDLFVKTFKNEFNIVLASLGFQKPSYNKGYYELTGFYDTPTGLRYFSVPDLRMCDQTVLMVRLAKDRRDYTGGSNRFLDMSSESFTNELRMS